MNRSNRLRHNSRLGYRFRCRNRWRRTRRLRTRLSRNNYRHNRNRFKVTIFTFLNIKFDSTRLDRCRFTSTLNYDI